MQDEFIFRSVSPTGMQRVRKVKGFSHSNAKDKALEKYGHVRYFGKGNVVNYLVQQQPIKNVKPLKLKRMVLMEAIERAKKASKEQKKPYYITYDPTDGECSVGSAPIGDVTHKYVNGELDKTYKPKVEVPKAKADAPVSEGKKESSNKKVMATAKVKKSAKKVSKKNTAPKKAKGEGRVINWVSKKEGWGSRVKLSIADQIAKIKKGHVIRDPQGKVQGIEYLKTRANQEYVREVYLAKAQG